MTFKMYQFSPESNSRVIRMIAIPERWSTPYSPDLGFLHSWLQDDDDSRSEGAPRRQVNWGAISGLALSLTISVTFWAGLAIAVERLLK